MSLGICVKALNAIHFSKPIDLLFEFVPQLTLMLVLFGWMDYLIIAKWLHDWEGHTAHAPGVISIMINMFLDFGRVPEEVHPLVGDRANKETQHSLSLILLGIAAI